MSDILFTPHHDDETLFAAYTLIKHKPIVVVCYPSVRDYGTTETRLAETQAALDILGAGPAIQWQGGDLVEQMQDLDLDEMPRRVWAPDLTTSHREHRAVFDAARYVFAGRLRTYHTYQVANVAEQVPIKVRLGTEITPQPEWVEKKLAALACYRSQIHHPRAFRFFLEDLREYLGDER